MSGFKFRLARVLDWYEEQCKAEENRLQSVMAALESIKRSIEEVCRKRASAEAGIHSGSVSPSDLTALASFQDHSRRHEARLSAESVKCGMAVELQRKAVQDARRKVRLMEKLRERRLAEHTYAVARELEQLAADAYQSVSYSANRIAAE
jgi:flagellar export protein FliJ